MVFSLLCLSLSLSGSLFLFSLFLFHAPFHLTPFLSLFPCSLYLSGHMSDLGNREKDLCRMRSQLWHSQWTGTSRENHSTPIWPAIPNYQQHPGTEGLPASSLAENRERPHTYTPSYIHSTAGLKEVYDAWSVSPRERSGRGRGRGKGE